MSGALKNPTDKRRLAVKSYPRTVLDGLRSSEFSLLFFHCPSSDFLFFFSSFVSSFFPLSLYEPSLSVSRVTSNIFSAASTYIHIPRVLSVIISCNDFFFTRTPKRYDQLRHI